MNMKAFKYNIVALASLLLAGVSTSCNDFLDTNPSTSVADSEVFQTVAGAQAALNGCYYHMSKAYPPAK